MANRPTVEMTLRDGVNEIMGLLFGQDLVISQDMDQFYAITRQINRALRLNSVEVEWSYYSGDETVLSTTTAGMRSFQIPSRYRPRITNDDALKLVGDQGARYWAYFLPRDSISKYSNREGLWAAVTGQTITLSRPLRSYEAGFRAEMAVMREPELFELPVRVDGVDPTTVMPQVPDTTLNQLIDFDYPDVVLMRAAAQYAMTHPLLQPRVQELAAQAQDLMYGLKTRDERRTDNTYLNEFMVPVESSLYADPPSFTHGHPHADERRL